MITQDSIEALKARLDIVDVVGSYVELKKAGANYKALCPFHDEKTPSFVVSPAKQIYHCFSCGEGGDSIKFVMEHEKLSYPEALEKLASSYNFTLSYSDEKSSKERSKLLDKINEWYRYLLTKNQKALSYLKERGIYESSIEKFSIGYAPDSNSTINYIKSQLFSMQEALHSGVAGYEGGRNFARFIERITFPIHSANGVIIGFGGRTISGHQAKYVNSPETKLFNKSNILYAYHHAKQSIHKTKRIIVTEGYLDVVMLHQAGFTNAVATLGTALTPSHLPLLRKGEPDVVMAYDGDAPGRAAALKASKLLSVGGFGGGVIIFDGGADPADMVKSGLTEELSEMFRSPRSFIEFVIDEILVSYDLSNPKAKEECMLESVEYLKTLSEMLREKYKVYLAQRLGINPSFIKFGGSIGMQERKHIKDVNRYRDMWELSVIKTVLEQPSFIDLILDVLDPSLLQFHSKELMLAIKGRVQEPSLMAISVDEQIKSIKDEESLRAELIAFLIKHYEREYKKINMRSDISFEQKAFLIRKYRGNIARLKRGELVVLKD